MNTTFLLLAEFETSTPKLEDVAPKYFGINANKAKRDAALQSLPVPAFKLGTNKSPWLIHIEDLAKYIDQQRCQAQQDHNAMAS